MIEKRILFTKESAAAIGGMYAEPPVSLLRPGHTKIAEVETPLHETVKAFIQTLKPAGNETWVLINALGAGEYYGDNINGDYFPYKEMVTHNDEFLSVPPHDVARKKEVASRIGYGYPTFYNAHIYKHHVNKDPSKSFGSIEVAVWNEVMKRVELVVRLVHELCEKFGAMDIVHRINDGEYPDTSMGCRVPYDVCSICGNQAKTKAQYCEHINNRRKDKDPRGDGQRPYMINIRPKYFDNSFVFIGADKTARTLMKIAGVEGELFQHIVNDIQQRFNGMPQGPVMKTAEALYVDGYQPYEGSDQHLMKVASQFGVMPERLPQIILNTPQAMKIASVDKEDKLRDILRKVAQLQKENKQMKLGDIIKYVVPNPKAKEVSQTLGGEPDLPESLQDELGEDGLDSAINTTARKGIVMKPHEFMRVALVSSGMKGLADKLKGTSPAPSDEVCLPCSVEPGEDNEELGKKLLPMLRERSIAAPVLVRRIIQITVVKPKELDKEPELAKNELLDKVSSAYNGYRLWLIANADELGFLNESSMPNLEDGFGAHKVASDATSIDLEMASAYLQGAYWRAGERNA